MFKTLQSGLFRIEPLLAPDMMRMQGIMERYADNQFDYVDTAIMALSERLQIEDIYSLDRRDFRVFRPAHCAYL
jgi:predicted nucleic acid-binding protein